MLEKSTEILTVFRILTRWNLFLLLDHPHSYSSAYKSSHRFCNYEEQVQNINYQRSLWEPPEK